MAAALVVYVGFVLSGMLAARSALSFTTEEWASVKWDRGVVVALLIGSILLWVIPIPLLFYWGWLHPRLRRARRRRLDLSRGC